MIVVRFDGGPGADILRSKVEPLRLGALLHTAFSSPAEYHAPMARRRLPIGIQTFRKVREGGCYYVDKSAYLRRLVEEGTHYFLSRPRRFGKSLLVDTLKELFEGSEALFEGLAIHDGWDWSVRHPTVRLDFAAHEVGSALRRTP